MLIDVWREVGLEGIAQVDLDEHRNRHQPLAALTPMARTVLATIAGRVRAEGRLSGVEIAEPVIERPPLAGATRSGDRFARTADRDGTPSLQAPVER